MPGCLMKARRYLRGTPQKCPERNKGTENETVKLLRDGRMVYTIADVAWLRKAIRIGEAIHCKVAVKDLEDTKILSEKMVRATVIGKYPYIVEAMTAQGRRVCVSYVDMITDPDILCAPLRSRLTRLK